jgi:hypothetical protein
MARWRRGSLVTDVSNKSSGVAGVLLKLRALYPHTEENIMFKLIRRFAEQLKARRRMHPPKAEEDLGGGDICSLQEQASTDDDQPLH